jgi:hypothetical protein
MVGNMQNKIIDPHAFCVKELRVIAVEEAGIT